MISSKKKKKQGFLDRLMNNYRITILKDESFEEKYSGTFSPMKIILICVLLFFLSAIAFWFLYTHTPIRHSIPGYPHQEMKNSNIENTHLADSLRNLSMENELAYKNLITLLNGGVISDNFSRDTSSLNPQNPESINYEISDAEALVIEKIASQSEFDIIINSQGKKSIYQELLIKPLDGVISDGVDFKGGHFGIDISAPTGTRVKSILDGTVIFSGFTASGGNEIHVQHGYDLISIYKHNSAVLKKAGNKVIAGESIAVVGNSGEHSTGTHLHFEMWEKGSPLDPQDYFTY